MSETLIPPQSESPRQRTIGELAARALDRTSHYEGKHRSGNNIWLGEIKPVSQEEPGMDAPADQVEKVDIDAKVDQIEADLFGPNGYSSRPEHRGRAKIIERRKEYQDSTNPQESTGYAGKRRSGKVND